MSGLSSRGRRLIDSAPMSPYFEAHVERRGDPDYVGLCVAENKLVWDLLRPKLTAPRPGMPPEAIWYDDWTGSHRFREQLGSFMGRTFLGRRFDPEHIAVLAGAGSVLEMLFHNIADPGDGVLVPTPSYAGFWADLETRDELHIVPVDRSSEDGFRLTEDLLDRAFEEADRPIAALLYTNPDNPLGTVADADEIEMIVRWSERRGIHLVVDEIYALSVHGDAEFRSVATVRPELGDRIHITWAFSKDFGASGLRCGVLVTENEELMASIASIGYWSLVSGDTQYVLGEMIDDAAWVDRYLAAMRSGLADSYRRINDALVEHGIPHVPAAGGFFFLVDLRSFLRDATWEAEDELWRRILDGVGVNLTPGSACRIEEPGFFRVCFATEPAEVVVSAIERMARVVRV